MWGLSVLQFQGFALLVLEHRSWASPGLVLLGFHVRNSWNHVELHGQHFVVEIGTVVLLHCSLGILGSLISHSGRSEELAELVAIKSAHLEVSNLEE